MADVLEYNNLVVSLTRIDQNERRVPRFQFRPLSNYSTVYAPLRAEQILKYLQIIQTSNNNVPVNGSRPLLSD